VKSRPSFTATSSRKTSSSDTRRTDCGRRVSDFGLAKTVNPLTLLATAAGTLAFKPRKAFSERKGDSCAADVWAIGATLYLLLTDRLPFEMPAT